MCHAGTWLSAVLIVEQMDSFHSMTISINSSWFDPQHGHLFCVWYFSPLFIWRCVVYPQPSSTSRTWYTRYFTAVRYYMPGIYTFRVLLLPLLLLLCLLQHSRCCCSICCCSSSCAVWQKLLLVHRIWFHSVLSFSSNTIYFLTDVPLGSTVAFTASICLYYILGNYAHARSQGGRQPARRGEAPLRCM